MPSFPKPVFGINDLLRSGTVILDTTLAGFPFSQAQDGRTDSQVGLLGNGTARSIKIDLGSTKTFDYIAIARHNLFTASGVINIAVSPNDITYTTVGTLTGASFSDKPILFPVSGSGRYVRLNFQAPSIDIFIADVTMAEQFEWPFELPAGFTPPRWADNDEINVNRTRGGALAGFSTITKPKSATIPLRFQELSFYDSDWDFFVSGIKNYPFYLVWNPDKPLEVMFGWLPTGKSVPQPKFIQENLLDATFSMEGFA